MADEKKAWLFVLGNEDRIPPTGKVTPEPGGGKARLGLNSHWHPEALADGFYEMPLSEALVYAENKFISDYWAMMQGQRLEAQLVATKWVDLAFNGSVKQSTKLVQRAVNCLRSAAGANIIAVDGVPGPATVAAVNTYLDDVDVEALYEQILKQGAAFYDTIQKEHPEKFSEKLESEWLERLEKRPSV